MTEPVSAFGPVKYKKDEAWAEVEETLRQFEGPAGFEGPCELVVAVDTK